MSPVPLVIVLNSVSNKQVETEALSYTIIIFDEFTDDDETALADHTISPTNLVSAVWISD